jgi:hypothetical protein
MKVSTIVVSGRCHSLLKIQAAPVERLKAIGGIVRN